ncbi:hypothetical protein A5893_06465 [Pedobacter psychrophilus]|uniref:DUF3352 domain-containing protein n=1 Tax=Pedobacter psychrophilus TaxID=1826909 RepID=A0A179DJH9_9SPHI|nr:hypothetical protein [Pedobacter psychrophilus]OAQ40583.1 hypothetical protein A5893_06465 [Pedobacter psychrophilus]
MKKIIIIVSLLFLGIIGVTWLYFKNLSSSEYSNEKIFSLVPNDASIVFEYKNETTFYDIFKDFNLFSDILGKETISHLNAVKQIFVDNQNLSPAFIGSDVYFALDQTEKNNAQLLLLANLAKNIDAENDVLSILKSKYKINVSNYKDEKIYKIAFSNQSKFRFFVHKSIFVGSFDSLLLNKSINLLTGKNIENQFKIDNNSVRNKNSIANLYLNFDKLPDFFNNFSNRKNPEETFNLKNIKATASLNINYQSNAFMFSGITNPQLGNNNYFNLFLSQQPGANTLINIIPFDVASYSFYFTSNYRSFKTKLQQLQIEQKKWDKLKNQLDIVSKNHAVNLDKELIPVIGKEFGVFQLASGDKIGIVKTSNTNRLRFLLSTISSEINENIRHFDDSYLLEAYFGQPFENFRRPYFAFIENHLVFANNTTALNRFLENYKNQKFLSRTDKHLDFQQYLSNQGNIFFFVHNSNSKALIRSFLSGTSYNDFKSDNFNWKDIYGFAIQFSADKDKFFTNMYMNKMPLSNIKLPSVDSLLLDNN